LVENSLSGVIQIVENEFLQRDPYQWRMIFFLAAGVATLATLVFVIFGSGDVQNWNETKRKSSNEENFIQ